MQATYYGVSLSASENSAAKIPPVQHNAQVSAMKKMNWKESERGILRL